MLTVTRVFQNRFEQTEYAEVEDTNGVRKIVARAEVSDPDTLEKGDDVAYQVHILDRRREEKS